jgi:hypothetical protein
MGEFKAEVSEERAEGGSPRDRHILYVINVAGGSTSTPGGAAGHINTSGPVRVAGVAASGRLERPSPSSTASGRRRAEA